MKVQIQPLSRGLFTASGGTRVSVKRDRPWQTDIVVDKSKCPFETTPQVQVASYDFPVGHWKLLENMHTPFSWHRLIIPSTCWAKEQIRILGGQESIATALRIALEAMHAESGEFWLGVHVGPSAGQNTSHLHYHLLKPFNRPSQSSSGRTLIEHISSSPLILFEDEGYRVVLGGYRAGQCFISPTEKACFGYKEAEGLARVLARLVDLYNKKFERPHEDERLRFPPDYILSAKFLVPTLIYVTYIPILNNWGFTEYLGLMEERPLILPWPHEESLRYLKEP